MVIWVLQVGGTPSQLFLIRGLSRGNKKKIIVSCDKYLDSDFVLLDDVCTTPPKKHNESIEMLRSPKSAMNDTQKIKKTKSRVEPDTTQHNSTFNLNELKKVQGWLKFWLWCDGY